MNKQQMLDALRVAAEGGMFLDVSTREPNKDGLRIMLFGQLGCEPGKAEALGAAFAEKVHKAVEEVFGEYMGLAQAEGGGLERHLPRVIN